MPNRDPEPPRFALVVWRDTYEIGCIPLADVAACVEAHRVFVIAREDASLMAVVATVPVVLQSGPLRQIDPGDENDWHPCG